MKLLFLLFSVFTVNAEYTDAQARFKIFPMAAAALVENPQPCISNTFTLGTLVRRIQVMCDETQQDTCNAFTAYSDAEKVMILSFRGTNGLEQLLLEADETAFSAHVAWPSGGNVSKYFNDAFFKLWNGGVKSDLLTLINKNPDYNLMVTGHSLGGALAVLGASYIAALGLYPLNQIELMTFGEPRVGDATFAASIDNLLPGTFRVTHNKDIVPHLPFRNMEGYVHHHSEVYYHEDMGIGQPYRVCTKDESLLCSDGNIVDFSVSDHMAYYNVDLGVFSANNCNATLLTGSQSQAQLRSRRSM